MWSQCWWLLLIYVCVVLLVPHTSVTHVCLRLIPELVLLRPQKRLFQRGESAVVFVSSSWSGFDLLSNALLFSSQTECLRNIRGDLHYYDLLLNTYEPSVSDLSPVMTATKELMNVRTSTFTAVWETYWHTISMSAVQQSTLGRTLVTYSVQFFNRTEFDL